MGGSHAENRLQNARKRAGKTQEDAADYIGCGSRTLQRYESGERQPNLTHLMKMQVCYNCEITDLVPIPSGQEGKQ